MLIQGMGVHMEGTVQGKVCRTQELCARQRIGKISRKAKRFSIGELNEKEQRVYNKGNLREVMIDSQGSRVSRESEGFRDKQGVQNEKAIAEGQMKNVWKARRGKARHAWRAKQGMETEFEFSSSQNIYSIEKTLAVCS
jgi:hypothetical protein